jgi:hypothetical protein
MNVRVLHLLVTATFIGFKTEEYTPFIFLGTEECTLLFYSERHFVVVLLHS